MPSRSEFVDLQKPAGLLHGIRVLTVDNYFAGNYGPQLLAFHGAEVVKIERPGSGDGLRSDAPYMDPEARKLSHGEVRLMRGKRSVALDIRTDEGKCVLRRLVKAADVFWTNLRPGAAKRLGVDAASIQELNPQLVYASLTGFGLPGAHPRPFGDDQPAFDVVIQALTGLMHRNADADGSPQYNGVAIADQVSSLFAAFGVVTALLGRERGKEVASVDVAMFDAMVALNEKTFTLFSMDGRLRPARVSSTSHPFGPYQGRDGYLVIGVGGNTEWRKFCKAIGREDLAERQDLDTGVKRLQQDKEFLRPLIEQWLQGHTVSEASKILLDHDVPGAPILNVDSPLMRRQALERGITRMVSLAEGSEPIELVVSPVRMSVAGEMSRDRPPKLGEDTAAVMREWLGMDDDELQTLARSGIVNKDWIDASPATYEGVVP